MNKIADITKEYNLKIRKSTKAKNVVIRIVNQHVELVLPLGVSEKFGYKFLLSKEKWIQDKLKNLSRNFTCAKLIRTEYPIFGELHQLVHTETTLYSSIFIKNNQLVVYSKKCNLNSALKAFLKNILSSEIGALCAFYAKQYNFKYNKIAIKELRTKWGSCSALKNLNFNWRIIFAPKNILNYLVIHELCHLREMNHSDKFWNLVAEIDPNYKESRLWLRKNGHQLYNYLPN
jgi:hypothetical protein